MNAYDDSMRKISKSLAADAPAPTRLAADAPAILAFDGYLANLELRLLTRTGHPLPLHGLAFDLLALLLRNSGRLVTREAAERALWAPHHLGAAEQSLNKLVGKIRNLLRDSAIEPRFIRTLPRQGWVFLRPVTRAEYGAARHPSPPHTALGASSQPHLEVRIAALVLGPRLGDLAQAESMARRLAGLFHEASLHDTSAPIHQQPASAPGSDGQPPTFADGGNGNSNRVSRRHP